MDSATPMAADDTVGDLRSRRKSCGMDNATSFLPLLRDHRRTLAQPFWPSPIRPEFTATRLLDSLLIVGRHLHRRVADQDPRGRAPGSRGHPAALTQGTVSCRWGDRFCPPFPVAGSRETWLP